MTSLHRGLGIALVAAGVAGLLWAGGLALTHRAGGAALRAFVAVALAAVGAQAALGLVLLVSGHRPGSTPLHLLYAVMAVVAVAVGARMAGRLDDGGRLRALAVAMVALALFGLRAAATGSG